MKNLVKDMWYIGASTIQFAVNDRATAKGYDVYVNPDSGTVYFSKKKQAKKVAKFLDLETHLVYNIPVVFIIG